MRTAVVCIVFLFIFSCSPEKERPLFELVTGTGINFNNRVVDGQVENSFYFRNFYNGGGVAIGDINNDSLPDVLFSSNMGDNKLYLNKGDFRFEDISRSAGLRQDSMWSTGVVMADINADGWLDIYECNSGHMKSGKRNNKLYINQRNNTFSEEGARYGLDISGYCTQSSFFDYDRDGDLDMFLINNSPMPINNLGYSNRRNLPDSAWPVAEFLKGGGDHLYRNENGVFREVSQEAGIHGTLMSFGLGVSVGDVNDDGFPDVYVANDSYERDYLYINQGDGTFRDDLENCIGQNSFSSMGADISDVNNDGYADIFTTDMLPAEDFRLKTLGAFDHIDLHLMRLKTGFYNQYMKNCLMVNNKNGQFLETANFSGVEATDWSWGALFFDADNDGLNDIFVCNGVNRDVTNLDFMDFFANDIVQKMVESGEKTNVDSVLSKIPVYPIANCAFKNGGNLKFSEVAKEWGLAQPSFSNGAAYADLDNDGDLDLVVNNENQTASVYRNHSRQMNQNNYIGVSLKAFSPNTFAIGSKIKLYTNGQVLLRELIPSRGFQSSMDYKQLIGIGKRNSIDSMVIVWPDGVRMKMENPKVNMVHYLEQPADGSLAYRSLSQANETVFEAVPATSFEKHQEDDFIDFYYERNLPQMLSREGSHVTKGDVNGDGLEDVYAGGARGQAGQLYLQNKTGSFIRNEQQVFDMFRDFEDVAVHFFDADEDKDLDLFIGAGGNNVHVGGREIEHRLYRNDGKGNFSIDAAAFPTNSMNVSVASSYDYDGDGDQDLFVGCRSIPFEYGNIPRSYIYQNDGKGHFKDVTPASIAQAGMVTGAVWADLSGDHQSELIITGQWMPTRIFAYNNGRFVEKKKTGLEAMHGWWQCIAVTDVNADGKNDLVIGNIGENFYLRPDASRPVKLWVADFDKNNTIDQFLTRTVNGRDVPVFLKREITDQFPGLKKGNLKHSDFAGKSIQQLFAQEVLSNARQLKFNFCASIVAVNKGDGAFDVQVLPVMTQLSSVNAICMSDVNQDGKPDLILGGNMFSFPPQFGRLDASYGHVLINNGKGGYHYMENRFSGITVKGEIKDITALKTQNGVQFLITRNDSIPVIYRLKKKA
jgi:hypothetical protein